MASYTGGSCCSVAQSCWLFATPWAAVHQACLSFTISQSLLRFQSTEQVMVAHILFQLAFIKKVFNCFLRPCLTWAFHLDFLCLQANLSYLQLTGSNSIPKTHSLLTFQALCAKAMSSRKWYRDTFPTFFPFSDYHPIYLCRFMSGNTTYHLLQWMVYTVQHLYRHHAFFSGPKFGF